VPKSADQKASTASAPVEKVSRPFIALAWLFVVAFAAAVSAQIVFHHNNSARMLEAAQASTAALIAERVNANFALVLGAGAGAAAASEDAHTLVDAAASSAPAAAAAALLNSIGEIEAITDASHAALAIAAAASAESAIPLWTGAPEIAGGAAPVIVRRLGARTLVTIVDPAALLPQLDGGARIVIVSKTNAPVYVSPALQRAGPRVRAQMLAAVRDPARHSALYTDAGRGWAVAAADAQLGGLRVVAASPAPSGFMLWLGALLRFAFVAAAPLAAMGVLTLLMRQNAQRARLAETEAARAENHFRIAADGARVGVLEWLPISDEVQLSEQAAHLMGAPRDTLSMRAFLDLIASEDRLTAAEEFRRGKQSGLLDARFRVNHRNGQAWIEVRGTAVEDARKRRDVRLIGTMIDVTQRYEAQARVSHLERQLRAAIENFSGPFALWDSRRRLLLWNQSFANAFKLGTDLLRTRASYETIAAASAAAIKREKHDDDNPDVRIVELSDGVWLHIVERRAADGGLITVGVDITPLKRKEEELARNERRLTDLLTRAETQEYRIKALASEAHEERQKAEEASRAKSTFLANMSHELRTPLNAVIGFSEIMAKELFGPLQNEQYKQYAHDIFDSGNHLLDLINDILDMAKIEANKLTLSPRPLDPMLAIEQAVRLTKRKAEDKGLSIVIDAEALPEIEADHRAVKQILLNLLSNAVKFTDKGAIMVHARGIGSTLTLRVVDTGCGIPPEHLPRLARPFEQIEEELTRNHHGTGLGLALTKSLAEMHGGAMAIQSEVGRGTIVTVTLPRTFGGRRESEAEEAA
jgi:two-component system, cell cycle sensor histidine kinase PleC